MAIMTVTINDPNLDKKSAEVAYVNRCLETVITEIGRGNGTVTTGVILGMSATGVPNTALGSWTYLPTATRP
jgi:hypothetical protein